MQRYTSNLELDEESIYAQSGVSISEADIRDYSAVQQAWLRRIYQPFSGASRR